MKKIYIMLTSIALFCAFAAGAWAATHVVYKAGQSPCTTKSEDGNYYEEGPYTCSNRASDPQYLKYYECGVIGYAAHLASTNDKIIICPAGEDNPYEENVYVFHGPRNHGLTIVAYDPAKNHTVVKAKDPNRSTFYMHGRKGTDDIPERGHTISGLTITGATGPEPGSGITCCKQDPLSPDGHCEQSPQYECSGIRAYGTEHLHILDNYLTGNNHGLIIKDTGPNWYFVSDVAGNEIYNNNVGIKLRFGELSHIKDNYIHNNSTGLLMLDTFKNRIYGNIFDQNGIGIELSHLKYAAGNATANNKIYHNNIADPVVDDHPFTAKTSYRAADCPPDPEYDCFMDRIYINQPDLCMACIQCSDIDSDGLLECQHHWYEPTLFEGNYWSDYAGVDDGSNERTAGDGIGDTNIPHPAASYDNYPFMNCYPNWENRQRITISSDMTIGDLSNFPMLIKITDQDNPVFTKALANGDDIFFTSSDCIQRLDHEVEYFAITGTKELVAWVKIPFLSSAVDTAIYMYYGNASAAKQEKPADVWDSNYVMVQHLSETTGQHLDSTGLDNDSNDVNVTAQGQKVTAKIGGADEFDAMDDYINISDPGVDSPLDLVGDTPVTFSAWIYPRQSQNKSGGIITKLAYGAGYRGFGLDGGCQTPPSYSLASMRAGKWGGHTCTDEYAVNPGSWNYVVYTYDASAGTGQIYVNGFPSGQPTIESVTAIDSSADLTIGNWVFGRFDGFIDEVRISNINRPLEWTQAEYNNQSNPGSYLTFGPEESH